jgi:hypothetical protein
MLRRLNRACEELTVGQLIRRLQEFPPDAQAYAYEGEDTGIAVGEAGSLGWIPAHEWRSDK